MSEWKKVKLKKLLKEVSERNNGQKVERVLSVTNSQGFVNQDEYFEGTVHSADISNYKIVRKNQFAYNPSRVNVGSIDILKNYEEGALSPMYVIFEVDKDKLLPEYFKYYFQTNRFYENVKNNTQGSVRNSLSFKSLADFDYLLPPIKEQEKIVEILKTIDSIIEKYENLLEEKNKFIKSQFVKILKDKNIKKYSLNEIAQYWNGLTYSPSNVKENGMIVLRSSNIKNSKLNFEDIIRVDCDVKEKNIVEENDILMCSRNGSSNLVGKVALIRDLNETMCFGAFMMIIRSKYYKFLYYYFQNSLFRKNISLETTTQINQITVSMLDKIEVPIPPKECIDKFNVIEELIDKQRFLLERQKQNYQKLKKGLMQQLLTGKVKVNV